MGLPQPLAPIESPLLLSIGIRDRQALQWIQVKAPLLLAMAMQPLRDAKVAAASDQVVRAYLVGRDSFGMVDGSNYGHGIRQAPAYDHRGELLRPADVEINTEGDVTNPNRVIRRARRSDPLVTLLRIGTITDVEFDAAESLRNELERQSASLPAGTLPGSRSPPWSRIGISAIQIDAMAAVRDALAAVSRFDRMPLLWVLAGGSIAGFARLSQRHHQAVTQALLRALVELVNHYSEDEA